MKTLPLFILLLSCCLLGCRKEQPPTIPPVNNPQPPYPLVTKKTVAAYGNISITTYRYDTASWRVKSVQDKYGIDVYEYDTTHYITVGNGYLKLNVNGLVEEDRTVFTPMQISYDSLDRVSEEYTFMSSRRQYTYYADGSLQSMIATLPDHFNSPQGPSITTYFYPNQVANYLTNSNYGMPYFGRSSTYLPDSATNVLYYAGDSILSYTLYNYTRNAAGWILFETQTSHHLDSAMLPTDTTISTIEYEYY